jgi:hypothetical protein
VTTVSGRRTLWEEGRTPGRLVLVVVVLLTVAVVAAEVRLAGRLGIGFDVAFVPVVVAAALAVRPRDFFVVGVLPPLVLFGVVLALTLVHRAAVADPTDGPVQAVVSGLAHHATALVVGYGLTLTVLALRQVAARNGGRLRRGGTHRTTHRSATTTRHRQAV